MNKWKMMQRALKQVERVRLAGCAIETQRQEPLTRYEQLSRRARLMPLAKLARQQKRCHDRIPGLLSARGRWAASGMVDYLPFPQQAELDELLARNSAVSRELLIRKEVTA